ncbi:MAG: YafY family protein [Candidatus Borkfalkiaceae bacterium]|nr:YafY family protein [Christensenellaceae bacterium]
MPFGFILIVTMKYQTLLAILFKMLSGEKVTLKYLAERFEISERTASRYLREIELANVPVLAERGRNGGYYIADSFRLPANFLTKNELSVLLGFLNSMESEIKSNEITALRDKILSVTKPEERELVLKSESLIIDGGSWNDAASPGILSAAQKAISNCKKAEISYVDNNGKQTRRVIEPHALVLKQGLWYVYAFCLTRQNFRLFRTSRIEFMHVLNDSFTRRKTGDFHLSYENWYSSLKREEILLEVSPSALSEVKEWLGVNAIFKKDGKIFARAALPSGNGLIAKLFSFAGKIKVIAPESVKSELIARAKNMIEDYT